MPGVFSHGEPENQQNKQCCDDAEAWHESHFPVTCCALAGWGKGSDIGSVGVNDNTKLNKYGFLLNGKQVEAITCQVMVIVSMPYYGSNRFWCAW